MVSRFGKRWGLNPKRRNTARSPETGVGLNGPWFSDGLVVVAIFGFEKKRRGNAALRDAKRFLEPYVRSGAVGCLEIGGTDVPTTRFRGGAMMGI